MEDSEHQNGAAIVLVLKGIGATEHLQEEFGILLPTGERASQRRMSAEDVSPLDKFASDACREVWRPLVEECRKSIEVSQGVERPLDLLARPLSKSRRAPRAEPLHHTVMWHALTVRGPGRSLPA